MSYQVIARRWRPQTFDEVVGQGHVSQTLKNAIAQGRVAHALLFAGPRGVGKTTMARILAKALNCEAGPTTTPCNACGPCQEVANGRSVDCLEIDGASNRGIDEVRELRENVRYAPSRGKSKVVIIDEAHMLTEPAFNALLKTLEEPPPRVLFILATTEPHKIPPTIHSRCQRHDFRRLGRTEIVGRLAEIGAQEKVSADPDALDLIAQAAQGSLRDAQSILDQAIAYAGDRLTRETVAGLLGLVEAVVLAAAADALLARDAGRALQIVQDLSDAGHDLRQFCHELQGHLRDLLVARACDRPEALLEGARVDVQTIKDQARRAGLAELELMLRALQHVEGEMRRGAYPRHSLEMALVRMSDIPSLTSVDTLLRRLGELEGRLGASPVAAGAPAGPAELPLFARGPAAPPAATLQGSRGAPPPPPKPPATPPPSPAPTQAGGCDSQAPVGGGWTRVKEILAERKRLASVLGEVTAAVVEGEGLVLSVANGTAFVRETLEDRDTRRLLEGAAEVAFGRRLRVEYRFASPEGDPAAARDRSAAGCPPGAPGGGQAAGGRRAEGVGAAAGQEHPLVREALQLFGGRVVGRGGGPGASESWEGA